MNALRLKFEVLLLRIARWILIERNVARARYVSRRDNNLMWSMGEKIEFIEQQMLSHYEQENE